MNLGDVGGAGKLMGLAPYGRPVFYTDDFRGNCYDGDQDQWLDHCVGRAGELGYDLAALGDPENVLEPVCRDIAASTQKLFEESMLAAAAALHAALQSSGATTKNLCFSGGTALNCPANSLIAREGPFETMFIEPYCDDGGLAIGAAQAVYHSILDHPLVAGPKDGAYIGGGVGDVGAILEKFAGKIDAVAIEDPAERAAEELADDRIIAWIEGRSEAGPRALCHRSVLANPTSKENWARVNTIKMREHWRPLAPVVLADQAAEWFDGAPLPSPFMLFTGQVASDKLPAITHVDGSARIQTVDGTMGDFYHLLKSFYALTGVPVLLNTSLNGPGVPIAETLEDALPLLLETDLDALYCAGYRIKKST